MTPDTLPAEFIERFLLNAVVLSILLRFIYYRNSPSRDSLFGFFLFGHGVYLISALMHDVDISMGFAFGLFAVLSMLRYRTESISIRDMTYLFLVIVMSLMAAVGPISIIYLAIMSGIICLIVAFAETTWFAPRTVSKSIIYDNTINIQPQNRVALTQDLENRIGSRVIAVQVGNIDFLKDTAELHVTLAMDDKISSASHGSLPSGSHSN